MELIHDSGCGADRLQVWRGRNGATYEIDLGEAGAPMRNIFLQGIDAESFGHVWQIAEKQEAGALPRGVVLCVLDSYL